MKWVLYDVGGVLEIVDDERWQYALVERWSVRLGMPVDEVRARLAAARLPDMTLHSGVEGEYWQKFGAALEVAGADVAVMRSQFWDAYCGRANVELLDHARSLTGRAGLAILSNSADGARDEEERRFQFSTLFDPICYSHEQGVAKPEPGAYLAALEKIGASAGDVLFIDDNEGPVLGAEECGIRAILYRDNATTIAAIEGFLES